MKIRINNKKLITEADRLKIWSTKTRIVIKKPEGHAAVIDDTLALIRGIASITVVSSDTDLIASTPNKAYVELEFKFVPRSTSVQRDLRAIKHDILRVSPLILSIAPVKKMLGTLTRVQ